MLLPDDDDVEDGRVLGAVTWNEKVTMQHVFTEPKVHFYGTLGLALTAQPVGAEFSPGCYWRRGN